eukprot:6106906-Pyramimonas_sp.AAC.1
MEHHPAAEPNAVIWARCLRRGVGARAASVRSLVAAGALRSLWSGSLWPKPRLFGRGEVSGAKCRGRGQEDEHAGHCAFECPVAISSLLDDEEEHPVPEDLSKFRKANLDHGASMQPVVALGSFDYSVGMPKLPAIPDLP